ASTDSTIPPPLKAPESHGPTTADNSLAWKNSTESQREDINAYAKNSSAVIVNGDTKDYRRKKLQKLYNFLGERVPVDIVFAEDDYELVPLPPISKNRIQQSSSSSIQRRNSSQQNDTSPTRLSVTDKKRHLNRAVKLENLFGEIPPQNLFLP
ncbi:9474_t:CDS:1, partial [Acaulospora morrowiae]